MCRLSTWRKKGILLMTAALALCMCGCGEPQAEPETVEVKTVSVNPLQQQQTVTASLKDVKKREIYEGIISPYVEELSFAQDGIFLEYRVRLGDIVSKGDTLAVTDISGYQKQAESLHKQIE